MSRNRALLKGVLYAVGTLCAALATLQIVTWQEIVGVVGATALAVLAYIDQGLSRVNGGNS